MLRLDVSQGAPARAAPGNPFAGQPGARPEIWSWGLRNPWRFSFDRATGDMFIGDVGQGQREEVTYEPAGAAGLNHGWRRMEGNRCNIPDSNCNDGSLVLPILEYDHAGGRCSVTGGYVYRGPRFPVLDGVYFFADFCEGGVYAGVESDGSWQMMGPLQMGFTISTFGEDEAGEVYFTNFGGGEIYRIEASTTGPAISGGGVVNAASLSAGAVSPGSIVSVFGAGLSNQTTAAMQTPLPTTLGGSSLRFGGVPAAIFFSSPGQMNVVVPPSLEGQTTATLVPTRDGVDGPPTQQALATFAPGIFTMDQTGGGQGAVLVAGTGLLAAPPAQFEGARPARIGESLEIFGTGLGPVVPTFALQPEHGAPVAQGVEIFTTTQQPTVTIGGVNATVLFSGLAPGFVGLYQINVELDESIASGAAVPLQIVQGGAASNTVTVAIE